MTRNRMGLMALGLSTLLAFGCNGGDDGVDPDAGGDTGGDTSADTGDGGETPACGEPGQPVCAEDACQMPGDDLPPIQIFADNMVGCPGAIGFADRASVCAEGWSPCSAGRWVARRDGVAPTHHYWTDERLAYDYEGSEETCTVANATIYGPCSDDQPMRVCTADPGVTATDANATDSLGNTCTWANCSYNRSGANEYFGGCSDEGSMTAGVLCCQDDPSPCAVERNPCSNTEICVTDADGHSCVPIDPADHDPREGAVCVADASGFVSCTCPPFTYDGGDVCVPYDLCADAVTNLAQVAPGVASCAGSVTYENRNSLCAAGSSACTVAQVVQRVPTTFVPAWHQWLDDNLRWAGEETNCSVSLTEGSDSCATSPMRICAGAGDDSLDNSCNWGGCSLDTNPSYTFFGGCEGNLTASTLCCRP